MARPVEDALNDCIDRLLGGDSAEHCLARYPELAEALSPLLKAASAAIAAAAIEPRSGFAAETRYRLSVALSQRASGRRWPLLAWRWGAVAATLLLLLAGTAAAVPASAGALPDEPLYPVKRAYERIELMLPQDEATAAQRRVYLAQRRLDELEALERLERHVALPLLAELADETDCAAGFLERQALPPEALTRHLLQVTARQQAVLDTVVRHAPPESREALMAALERSAHGRARALQLLERVQLPPPPPPPPRSFPGNQDR